MLIWMRPPVSYAPSWIAARTRQYCQTTLGVGSTGRGPQMSPGVRCSAFGWGPWCQTMSQASCAPPGGGGNGLPCWQTRKVQTVPLMHSPPPRTHRSWRKVDRCCLAASFGAYVFQTPVARSPRSYVHLWLPCCLSKSPEDGAISLPRQRTGGYALLGAAMFPYDSFKKSGRWNH